MVRRHPPGRRSIRGDRASGLRDPSASSGSVGVAVGAYFEWWDGQERRVLPLGSDRVTVGSSLTNDVVIDEPSVSRVHAILQLISGTWMVEDCGSRNGTFVQGK